MTIENGEEVKNPLQGAEFKLLDDSGQTVAGYGQLTSDSSGNVTIEKLVPGKYSLVETKAPAGYILDPTPIEFELKANEEGIISDVNLEKVNYQGSAELIKHDSKGQPLSGAIFKVVDKSGKTIETNLTSDKDGKVIADGLAPGDYSFIETQAPTGYVLNTEPVHFTVADQAEGQPQIVMASDNFINYQGSAELIKHDSKGQPLLGAVFKVVDKSGKTIQTNLTSDKDGKVIADGLAPGDYSFIEVQAPTGYVLNTDPVHFTIAAESEEKPQLVMASDNFINYQGSAELIKHDSEGQPLSGAVFKVVDKSGKTIQTNLTSDKDGKVIADGLAPGDYSFIETQAPTGYILNTEKVDFTISDKEEGQPKVVTASDNFVNYQGSAELIKHDSEGQPLSGAVFKVVNESGEMIKEGLTSDKDGKVKIDDLVPGNYSFIETQAPAGYILNTAKADFTISDEEKNKPKVVMASDNFINYQGSAELVKVSESGEKLSGAVFKVVDTSKNEVVLKGLKSNSDGIIKANNLKPGKYAFVEEKAPTGYQLSQETKTFEIVNESENKPEMVKVGKFVNRKLIIPRQKSELPKMGEQENRFLPISGLAIFIFGIYVTFKRQKLKNK